MLEGCLRKSLFALLIVAVVGCGGKKDGGDPLDHLVVAPDGARIDVSTTVRVKATGVTRSGRHVPVSGVTWEATLGTVVDGSFSSASEGDAILTARAEGVEGSGTIEVVGLGLLDVRVIDATTGSGLSGATVSVDGMIDTELTAADGSATLGGPEIAGALDVTVRATNYHPVTLYGAKVKDLRIALRPIDPPAPGSFQGVIDFQDAYDRDDPPSGSFWLGFAGPAIRGNILSFGFDSLLGPDREISVGGFTFDAPSNVYAHGFTSNYIANAPAGPTAAFALGGEVTLQEITEIADSVGSSDLGAILAEAIPIFNRFYYAVEPGLTIQSNQTLSNVDLVLDTKLSRTANLSVPARPVTDPNPLLVAAADLGVEGFVPVGLNLVEGENELGATMKVPPLTGALADTSYMFLVVAQEGGTGSSDSNQQLAVLSRGVSDLGNVEFPEFFVPPSFAGFSGDGATGSFAFPATGEADFTLHTFTHTVVTGTDGNGAPISDSYQWDVATAGDAIGFVLPAVTGTHGAVTGASWSVQTLGLGSQTYEAVLSNGSELDITSYFDDANRIVITSADVD